MNTSTQWYLGMRGEKTAQGQFEYVSMRDMLPIAAIGGGAGLVGGGAYASGAGFHPKMMSRMPKMQTALRVGGPLAVAGGLGLLAHGVYSARDRAKGVKRVPGYQGTFTRVNR